jgi:hypothetical protein
MTQQIKTQPPKVEIKPEIVKVELKPEAVVLHKDFNKELDKAIAETKEKYCKDHLRNHLEVLELQLRVKSLNGGK